MTTNKSFDNVYGYLRCVMELNSYINNNALEDREKNAIKKFILELNKSLSNIYLSLGDKAKSYVNLLSNTEKDAFLQIIKSDIINKKQSV